MPIEKHKKLDKHTGVSINKNPELKNLVMSMLEAHESAYTISKILRHKGYRISYNTIKSFEDDVARLTLEEQKELIEFTNNLQARQRDLKNKFIENIYDDIKMYSEMLESLNHKATIISEKIEEGEDAKDVLALVGISKVILETKGRLEEARLKFGINKRELIEKVTYQVTELFVDKILVMIPKEKRDDAKREFREHLEEIERNYLDVVYTVK